MTNAAKKLSMEVSGVELVHQLSQQDAICELHEHTLAFANAVAEALGDFFDVEAVRDGEVEVQKGYRASGDVHFSIPFSGLVNGEYIINVEEAVAAELIECELPDASEDPEAREEAREEIGAALSELLNTAVGQVIGDLGGRYPHLTFASPRISYGQRVYPLIRFGYQDLGTPSGELRCHFYVDQMELDLATSYAKVRASAEKTRAALNAHQEMVNRILGAVNTGIFWVNPDATLRARYSAASLSILGVKEEAMQGCLATLVRAHADADDTSLAEIEAWISRAFEPQYSKRWLSTVYLDCPLRQSYTRDGRELRWRWLPVRGQGQDAPCALLVAIEDVALLASGPRGSSSDLVDQLAMSEWSVSGEN